MKRVLVLGASGMLGAMVVSWLSRSEDLAVIGTVRAQRSHDGESLRFPRVTFDIVPGWEDDFAKLLVEVQPDFIINAIGVINVDCRDDHPAGVHRAVRVNADFPHGMNALLANCSRKVSVIHITTDCVYSGRKGQYDETDTADPIDFYGKSKLTGEVRSDRWLNLRCSIIGPNAAQRRGLLEWVRSQPPRSSVPGFLHHRWNGVTTLQFAQFCEDVIRGDRWDFLRGLNHTLHYLPNESVTKAELVELIRDVYQLDLAIMPTYEPGPAIDRTLASIFLPNSHRALRDALTDLREFERKVRF